MDLRASPRGEREYSMRTARPRAAFTLLEVLIALAIFTMAAIVLGGSYLNILYAYEAADSALDRNEHLEFARAALMTEADREEVEKGGEFDGGNGRRVVWRALIEETETPDVFVVLFECEISAPDMKQPERIQQQFRLLRPTWSEGDDREEPRAKTHERINRIVGTEKR